MAILISDKIGFQSKIVIGDKEGHSLHFDRSQSFKKI